MADNRKLLPTTTTQNERYSSTPYRYLDPLLPVINNKKINDND